MELCSILMLNVCNLHAGLMDDVHLIQNNLFESFNAEKYGIDSLARFYEDNWDDEYYSNRYPTANGVEYFRFDVCDNGAGTPDFCMAEYFPYNGGLFLVDNYI